jgi:hypothetical protein
MMAKPPVLLTHDPRHMVAFHEAGHAVIAEKIGLPCGPVSIIRTSKTIGNHRLAVPFGECETWRLVTWMFAGPEAEMKFTGRSYAHAELDYATAFDLVDCTRRDTDPPTDALLDRYKTMAAAETVVHWAWISRVAVALLSKTIPILTADEVRALRPKVDR